MQYCKPILMGMATVKIICESGQYRMLGSGTIIDSTGLMKCIQYDVVSSTSFAALALERVRARPSLALALIGVVVSAACTPLNSSALVSCCCFCGFFCFLFGFPAAEAPQSKMLTPGGE